MAPAQTIVAISSSVLPAARLIVRLSGNEAISVAKTVCRELPDTPAAARVHLHCGELTLPAWVYVFCSPRSYTGEDLIEFHLPGNALLARMLIDKLMQQGARPAEAGEFTARAYFNGRMDLTEAEGVAATIHAQNEQELSAARQLLTGELSRRLRPMMEQVADVLARVEAGIDFSDEDVTFISAKEAAGRAAEVQELLLKLERDSARFERLSHEPTFVLVGRPNAGKSTLLNALAGAGRAVVSDLAGTTRDVLSAEVALERGIVRVLDVAGLEEDLVNTADASPQAQIARQMRNRALAAVGGADFVVLVKDATDPRPVLELPRRPDILVSNKSDLRADTSGAAIAVSARTGAALPALRSRMSELAFGRERGADLALNARHLRAITDAREALARARSIAEGAGAAELLALELRSTLDALGNVLGQITPDDVLGRVFATFCIGK